MFHCPAAAVAGFGGSILAEMPTPSLTTVSRPYCFSCMTAGFLASCRNGERDRPFPPGGLRRRVGGGS